MFEQWLSQAVAAQVLEPNAMTLATVTPEGTPDARIVLLKGIDPHEGFVFYTNYESRKGQELTHLPKACLVFFWPQLERQVRVEGTVAKVPDAMSDAYFASRPLESRIGAWASPQSRAIPDRDVLEQRRQEAEARVSNGTLPRPAHWGGYGLQPHRIEFWQGRVGRLHDRFVYTRQATDDWMIERLAP